MLIKRFKVKWWSNFRAMDKISKPAIRQWIVEQQPAPPPTKMIMGPLDSLFLAQKSHAQALLAAAKSEDEYWVAMQQLLESRTNATKSSSSTEPLDSTGDNDVDYDVVPPSP